MMNAVKRAKVLAKTDGHCTYCGVAQGEPLPHAEDPGTVIWPTRLVCDHIVPRSRGGSNRLENLTPACVPCNTAKGDKLLEEWRP